MKRNNLKRLLSAILVVAMLTVCLPFAAAASYISPYTPSIIFDIQTAKMITQDTSDPTALTFKEYTGYYSNAYWSSTSAGTYNGQQMYYLRPSGGSNSYCLTYNSSTNRVTLQPYAGTANQRWYIDESQDYLYGDYLVSGASGLNGNRNKLQISVINGEPVCTLGSGTLLGVCVSTVPELTKTTLPTITVAVGETVTINTNGLFSEPMPEYGMMSQRWFDYEVIGSGVTVNYLGEVTGTAVGWVTIKMTYRVLSGSQEAYIAVQVIAGD